jgi:hypothetical protein
VLRRPGAVSKRAEVLGLEDGGGPVGPVDSSAVRTVDIDGARLDIVPASNGVCVVGDSHSAACTATDGATSGRLLGFSVRQGAERAIETEVYGLMPDGVDRVTVEFEDGSRKTVRVKEGAFSTRGNAVPTGVTPKGLGRRSFGEMVLGGRTFAR